MAFITPIAHIQSDFKEKFGIPRQSNQVPELISYIIFEPEYRIQEALRGIDEYSYLWLIWEFSENIAADWSPTVRPPRLGGNIRKGVFATRSPFRPNPIGLSSVKLEEVMESREYGPFLKISGADLLDGTPIYDIKPYVPYSDSHPEAAGGFATEHMNDRLKVCFPERFQRIINQKNQSGEGGQHKQNQLEALKKVLELDPRPSYHTDEERIYGMTFAEYEVKFQVKNNILTVTDVVKKEGEIES